MWSDHCLEVDGCSSVDGFEGQHLHFESDAGCNRKPVEVSEEGGHMGIWVDFKRGTLQHSDYAAVIQSQRLGV